MLFYIQCKSHVAAIDKQTAVKSQKICYRQTSTMHYKQRITKLRRKTQLTPAIAQKLYTAKQKFCLLSAKDVIVFEKNTKKTPNLVISFAASYAKNCISSCKTNKTDVKNRAQIVCLFISLELGDASCMVFF